MKSWRIACFGAALGVLIGSGQLLAHHAQSAYDRSREMTLEGTVTKVEWANPHIFLFFDVKDASGKIENWGTEFSSPITLRRNYGWSRNTFQPGDHVSVTGNPRKDGAKFLWGQRGGDDGEPGIKKLSSQ